MGIALILGAFVGIAAVGGAFMNLNFMLAGSASTNPVLLLLGFPLVLAGKTAGYISVSIVGFFRSKALHGVRSAQARVGRLGSSPI